MNSVPKFSGAALELNSDELLAALRATPVAQKAVSDKSAAIAARRKQLADELDRLEHDAAKNFERQQTDIYEAQAALKRAEEALQSARQRLGLAHAARTTASFAYDRRRSEIEGELIGGANPAIAIFIEWCRDQCDHARREPIAVERDIITNKVTGKKTETRTTNHSSIVIRMDALRAAIADAEDLRLQADQSTIPAKLDELRASIPEVR